MKKIIKSFVVLCPLLFMMQSCDDFLSKDPVSQLDPSSFWKTADDANMGLIATYNAFSLSMSAGLWNWGEARSDNFTHNGKTSPDQQELVLNQIPNENAACKWDRLYTTINRANSAIRYIPGIEMTPSLKNHYLGEAYALRAWAYFYCIRIWGDVPLFLEPMESYTKQEIYKERTDRDYILRNVILPDLEQAWYLISKSSSPDRTRVNAGFVCALLMDVHAWMGNWEDVIKVKEEKVDGLNPDHYAMMNIAYSENFGKEWRSMFIENSNIEIPKEVLMKVTYDRDGNGTQSCISFFATSTSALIVTDNLRNAYNASIDYRVKTAGGVSPQWERSGSEKADDNIPNWGTASYRLRCKFYPDNAAFSNTEVTSLGVPRTQSDNDLVLYRYADIVLLYAEALNEQSDPVKAIQQLNITYKRATGKEFTLAQLLTKDRIAEEILNERRREFVGEGKRWFDLVRTGKWRTRPLNNMNEEWQTLFPIHRDHLIQNYKLRQNPGYQGI